MNIIEELNGMQIRTTQRTKTFYFVPVDGWKRGVNYRVVEDAVLAEVRKSTTAAWPNVKLVPGDGRYFEYYFSTTSTTNEDMTEVLKTSISSMITIAEKYCLELRYIGGPE